MYVADRSANVARILVRLRMILVVWS
jgi:hypothetical protein